jgi:hypothetical protein
MFLVKGFAVRIGPWRIELAEVLAEGDELRVRQILSMKNHDEPLSPSSVNILEIGLRYEISEIDACHLGT